RPDPGAVSGAGVLGKSNGVPIVTFLTGLETSAIAELEPTERPAAGPAELQERAAAIDEFVIAFSRGRPLALALGSLAEPLAQLTACTHELPRKWGLDPAVQQSLQRPPIPVNQASWLGPGSYPWTYLRNAQSLI